jgi:FlaA1/EpsC-like NDP-sugar epimerase
MKILNRKYLRPSRLILIGDQFLILFGFLSALLVNYRLTSNNPFPLQAIVYASAIQLSLGIVAWVLFRIYKKVIRFFSSKDYLFLVLVLLLIHASSVIIGNVFPQKYQFKFEVYAISFFISSSYIVGTRFLISYLYYYYKRAKKVENQKKLLIYGAGELGVFLKKSINTHYEGEYKLVAFIDDDNQKIGRMIGGVPVLSASTDIQNVIEKNQISDVIIANKTITPTRKAQFLETTLPYNISIREISSIQSFFGTEFNLEKLARIDIHDLMHRQPIELYDEHVVKSLEKKIVLVTGAAGSIGSEIVRKLSEHNAHEIVCVDFSESALYDLQQELKANYTELQYHFILADIRNAELMENVFLTHKPDFVYHAAAYKHVPLMELYPWEAVQTNVFGTLNIVNLAIKYQAEKFVFISSDKAVNPTSVMGATKRLAEIIVQSQTAKCQDTLFVVTRFGNVLGSNGSVVPLFKKQIQSGGPVTVTHPEMVRYFMTIAEACQLVLEASVMAKGGEIFVFDMGKPVKIIDLARNMIRLAGYRPDIDIKINFIGERPGEKLYEEIFHENEELQQTHHEKILISKKRGYNLDLAEHILETLQKLDGQNNPESYRKIIKSLLPEYNYSSNQDKIINFNPAEIKEKLNLLS